MKRACTGWCASARSTPTRAARRRFSSLDVSPIIDDDDNEIEIDMKDVRVDTYHASGAGGQNVNKTSSAVRMTHFPTGIVVAVPERARPGAEPRDTAMRMLRAKLVGAARARARGEDGGHQGRDEEDRMGQPDPLLRLPALYAWSRITAPAMRSSNVDAVMDGELDGFITAYLQMQ